MRRRLYTDIISRLQCIRNMATNADGEHSEPRYIRPADLQAMQEAGEELPSATLQHFDLWNENIAQLSKQRAFRTPAVFIEFAPYQWAQGGNRARNADITILLHIVTATLATAEEGGAYQSQALARFALIEQVDLALAGFAGAVDERSIGYSTFVKWESITDHNHEQVCEDIESYRTVGYDYTSVNRNTQQVVDVNLKLDAQ